MIKVIKMITFNWIQTIVYFTLKAAWHGAIQPARDYMQSLARLKYCILWILHVVWHINKTFKKTDKNGSNKNHESTRGLVL